MKFVEIETDRFFHSDQIVSIEFKVAQYNQQGNPFKYEIVTSLIDGRQVISPMDHKINLEPTFNSLIASLNS